MEPENDNMNRWTAEGYNPQLVSSAGGWTVLFGQNGGLIPEWAEWTGAEIWQATPEEAILVVALNEQAAADHRRSPLTRTT